MQTEVTLKNAELISNLHNLANLSYLKWNDKTFQNMYTLAKSNTKLFFERATTTQKMDLKTLKLFEGKEVMTLYGLTREVVKVFELDDTSDDPAHALIHFADNPALEKYEFLYSNKPEVCILMVMPKDPTETASEDTSWIIEGK